LPCFKRELKACRVAGGDAEIGAGETRPFFGRAGFGLGEVSDGKARAQRGAIGPVEAIEGDGQILTQPSLDARPEVPARPRGAEPFALQVEVGDLVEGVDGAQARIPIAFSVMQGIPRLEKAARVAATEPPMSMPRQASSMTTTSKPQRRASSAE
jgi:hypothetical protein